MKDYQLRILMYDIWNNVPRLRELQKEGVLENKDLWAIQEKAIDLAEKDGLLE